MRPSPEPVLFFASWEMFLCVRRGRQARVPVVSASVLLINTGLRRRACVNQEDMMLICMARHRHLASRYGGLTCYFVFFYFEGTRLRFFLGAEGSLTGVFGAGDKSIIIPAGIFWGGGTSNTDDIPPAGAIRLEIRGRSRRRRSKPEKWRRHTHLRQRPSRNGLRQQGNSEREKGRVLFCRLRTG